MAPGLNGRGGGGSAVSPEQAALVPWPRCHSQRVTLLCSVSDPFVIWSVSEPFVIALLLSTHTLSIFALCFFSVNSLLFAI